MTIIKLVSAANKAALKKQIKNITDSIAKIEKEISLLKKKGTSSSLKEADKLDEEAYDLGEQRDKLQKQLSKF